MEIDFTQLGIEAGSGAIIGGIIGFAAKKIAKVLAVIVGLELALFKFLESRGILTVDWEKLTAGIPLGRLGTVHEVAAAILYLSAPLASFLTGIALPLDGGLTAA